MDNKINIELDKNNYQIIKNIADYSKRSVEDVLNDLIKTFCDMPIITISDLEDFCINKLNDIKNNNKDNIEISSLSEDRSNSYKRINFLLDIIYKTQKDIINKHKYNTDSLTN